MKPLYNVDDVGDNPLDEWNQLMFPTNKFDHEDYENWQTGLLNVERDEWLRHQQGQFMSFSTDGLIDLIYHKPHDRTICITFRVDPHATR